MMERLQDMYLPLFEKAMLEDSYRRNDVEYRYGNVINCVVKVMGIELPHICSSLTKRCYGSVKKGV
eukprot:gnl/Chilomastix_caulleri/3168.p2 GENE.gnl/Chilomastix_caulleri/3168~~gnl/Chilomastix_caulleri/3168.p2  ORF type:complete len:66 (+),score=19.16 gnl/Chilomastix_caulleri/3168:196-393(+)